MGKDLLAEGDKVLKGQNHTIDAFQAKVGIVGTTLA
jgi:hypothetical protein